MKVSARKCRSENCACQVWAGKALLLSYIQHVFHCELRRDQYRIHRIFFSLTLGGFGYNIKSNAQSLRKSHGAHLLLRYGVSLATGNTKRGPAINIVRTVAHQINRYATTCLCHLINYYVVLRKQRQKSRWWKGFMQQAYGFLSTLASKRLSKRSIEHVQN